MRAILTTALVALMLAAPSAWAQSAPSPAELRRGLAGEWIGALGYRDYQSDQLFELPVRTSIEAIEDGVTQVRRSAFDDGPTGTVWIVSTSLDDVRNGRVTTATFRAGRDPEMFSEAVELTAYGDPEHWTLVYSRTGEDDEAPAEIRITETRDGAELLSIKEVRPVGAADDAWRFRNQTRLTRQAGD